MKQNTVVAVRGFFNRKTKKGWNTEYLNVVYLLSPTKEQIERTMTILFREFGQLTTYHIKGEVDRVVVLEAHYPEVHEDATLAYYGQKIAFYDFQENKIVFD